MSVRVRRPIPQPTFGYFRDGKYHAVAITLPTRSQAPPISELPGENPLLVGAQLSERLRADPAAE